MKTSTQTKPKTSQPKKSKKAAVQKKSQIGKKEEEIADMIVKNIVEMRTMKAKVKDMDERLKKLEEVVVTISEWMSEPSEPIKPEEHTEELNERLHESEVDDKKKILESMTQEELIELVLSSDETIKTKDSKIKAYEALIGTLITTVTDEKVKFGGLKREKEAYEAVYHQQLEKIEKMKATLVEGATLIARQEILINHFKDEYLPRTRRREHHDRSGCIIL